MDVAPTLGFLKQEVEGREKRSGAGGSKLLSLGGSSMQEKKGGGAQKGHFCGLSSQLGNIGLCWCSGTSSFPWRGSLTDMTPYLPGGPISPFSPGIPIAPSRPSRPSLPGRPWPPCKPGVPGMPGCPEHCLGILLSSICTELLISPRRKRRKSCFISSAMQGLGGGTGHRLRSRGHQFRRLAPRSCPQLSPTCLFGRRCPHLLQHPHRPPKPRRCRCQKQEGTTQGRQWQRTRAGSGCVLGSGCRVGTAGRMPTGDTVRGLWFQQTAVHGWAAARELQLHRGPALGSIPTAGSLLRATRLPAYSHPGLRHRMGSCWDHPGAGTTQRPSHPRRSPQPFPRGLALIKSLSFPSPGRDGCSKEEKEEKCGSSLPHRRSWDPIVSVPPHSPWSLSSCPHGPLRSAGMAAALPDRFTLTKARGEAASPPPPPPHVSPPKLQRKSRAPGAKSYKTRGKKKNNPALSEAL